MDYKFTKAERLNSKLIIDKLFAGGNASTVAFPLRIVYMRVPLREKDGVEDGETKAETVNNTEPPVSILVSVPKKRFHHHATDRNRMKRLIREAYRLNKHLLWKTLKDKEYKLAVAFVCITDQLPTFRSVNKSMVKALVHISERLTK